MHTYYGIWIDHERASVVKANKMGEMSIQHFVSSVESKNHGQYGDEHVTIINQNRHEERRHNEMKEFCREIVKHIMDADELVIFGPSTAKHDLHHEIEDHKVLNEKLKGIETANHMSSAELKDYVKNYFHIA